ncbi:MAG: hypothetical protein ABIG92_03620, partial [Candidatus Omnitrophota bacterium]
LYLANYKIRGEDTYQFKGSHIARIMLSSKSLKDIKDSIDYLMSQGITNGYHVSQIIYFSKDLEYIRNTLNCLSAQGITHGYHISQVMCSSKSPEDIKTIIDYLKSQGITHGYYISNIILSAKTLKDIEYIISYLKIQNINGPNSIAKIILEYDNVEKLKTTVDYLLRYGITDIEEIIKSHIQSVILKIAIFWEEKGFSVVDEFDRLCREGSNRGIIDKKAVLDKMFIKLESRKIGFPFINKRDKKLPKEYLKLVLMLFDRIEKITTTRGIFRRSRSSEDDRGPLVERLGFDPTEDTIKNIDIDILFTDPIEREIVNLLMSSASLEEAKEELGMDGEFDGIIDSIRDRLSDYALDFGFSDSTITDSKKPFSKKPVLGIRINGTIAEFGDGKNGIPVFDFGEINRIKDGYYKKIYLDNPEGELSKKAYRVVEFLGENGVPAKSYEELVKMVKEGDHLALTALDIKGAEIKTKDNNGDSPDLREDIGKLPSYAGAGQTNIHLLLERKIPLMIESKRYDPAKKLLISLMRKIEKIEKGELTIDDLRDKDHDTGLFTKDLPMVKKVIDDLLRRIAQEKVKTENAYKSSLVGEIERKLAARNTFGLPNTQEELEKGPYKDLDLLRKMKEAGIEPASKKISADAVGMAKKNISDFNALYFNKDQDKKDSYEEKEKKTIESQEPKEITIAKTNPDVVARLKKINEDIKAELSNKGFTLNTFFIEGRGRVQLTDNDRILLGSRSFRLDKDGEIIDCSSLALTPMAEKEVNKKDDIFNLFDLYIATYLKLNHDYDGWTLKMGSIPYKDLNIWQDNIENLALENKLGSKVYPGFTSESEEYNILIKLSDMDNIKRPTILESRPKYMLSSPKRDIITIQASSIKDQKEERTTPEIEGFISLYPKIEDLSQKVIDLKADRISGFYVDPAGRDVIFSDVLKRSEKALEEYYLISPFTGDGLEVVECTLFEMIGDNKKTNIWTGSFIPIMGDEIYHKDGTAFKEKDYKRCGLRKVLDEKGDITKVKAFVTGGRVVSFPGPWLVPYAVEDGSAARILSTYDSIKELSSIDVTEENLNTTLLKLKEEGKIELKIASGLEFKGVGSYNLSPKEGILEDFRGRSVYIPGLDFSYVKDHNANTEGGIGACTENERKGLEIEERLREKGAVFLADTFDTVKLFDRSNLPELKKEKYDEVHVSMRFNFNSHRISVFLNNKDPENSLDEIRAVVFEEYIKELFNTDDTERAREMYFESLYKNFAKNLKAALAVGAARAGTSNVSINWGPLMEFIDNTSIVYKEHDSLFLVSWETAFTYLDAMYKCYYAPFNKVIESQKKAPFLASERLAIDNKYFYEVFVPEFFGEDNLWVVDYFKKQKDLMSYRFIEEVLALNRSLTDLALETDTSTYPYVDFVDGGIDIFSAEGGGKFCIIYVVKQSKKYPDTDHYILNLCSLDSPSEKIGHLYFRIDKDKDIAYTDYPISVVEYPKWRGNAETDNFFGIEVDSEYIQKYEGLGAKLINYALELARRQGAVSYAVLGHTTDKAKKLLKRIDFKDPKEKHITVRTADRIKDSFKVVKEFDLLNQKIVDVQIKRKGLEAKTYIDPTEENDPSRSILKGPSVDLEKLDNTRVLFLDEQVRNNIEGFEEALAKLGDRNTVVVLTEPGREKEFQDFCLDNKVELGRFEIEDFDKVFDETKLRKDDMGPYLTGIVDINDLQCIPLTEEMLIKYPALKDA